MPSRPNIAIVGATGAVGREFLTILEERRFPHAEIRLFASPRSAGSTLPYRGEPRTLEALDEHSFNGIDIALFSAGSSVSKQFGPIAVRAGATVIDNSSAFRMDPGVPLVVPEVNPEDLDPVRDRPAIIANPNCSTIILLVPVTPLRNAFGVERLVVSTYQAVSGAGAAAMDELREQTAAVLAGRDPMPKVFREPCAFNVFSHNTAADPLTGRNVEEQKMIDETRKMWRDPAARVSATCIRVGTMRAHAESINITLSRPASEAQVLQTLQHAPGLRILDDRARNDFPTPLKASGRDEILVGRIRPDDTIDPVVQDGSDTLHRAFNLFVCGDQIRKGAALNAVQIAELIL